MPESILDKSAIKELKAKHTKKRRRHKRKRIMNKRGDKAAQAWAMLKTAKRDLAKAQRRVEQATAKLLKVIG